MSKTKKTSTTKTTKPNFAYPESELFVPKADALLTDAITRHELRCAVVTGLLSKHGSDLSPSWLKANLDRFVDACVDKTLN